MAVPIPIENDIKEQAEKLGYVHKVISGPDGDLTGDVRPVEALICFVESPVGVLPELSVLIQLEEDDKPLLEKGGYKFWITFTGHIVPFSVSVFDPEEEKPDAGE